MFFLIVSLAFITLGSISMYNPQRLLAWSYGPLMKHDPLTDSGTMFYQFVGFVNVLMGIFILFTESDLL